MSEFINEPLCYANNKISTISNKLISKYVLFRYLLIVISLFLIFGAFNNWNLMFHRPYNQRGVKFGFDLSQDLNLHLVLGVWSFMILIVGFTTIGKVLECNKIKY